MKGRSYQILPLLICLTLIACSHLQPTPASTPTQATQINADSINLVKEFGAAWTNRDTEKLLPLYSQEVVALDADSYGYTYNYSTVSFAMNLVKSGDFYFEMTSFFVTADGQFAVLIGPWWTLYGGEYTSVPAMTLLEIDSGLVVWEYDYYASSMSQNYPLPEIPLEASEISASENEIAQIEDMLTNWATATNGQDSDTIPSYYAENASIILMADPEWKIQTKSQMVTSLEKDFADETLSIALETTFISANGQYAAVQGLLQLANKQPEPFIMLLEIENGEIITQYIFLNNQLYYEFFS